MIQQPVDDDAGDRDIEPEREGPAGDAAMSVEARGEAARDGDERERDDDDGQDGVRAEQNEVERTNPSLALKTDDAGVQMIEQASATSMQVLCAATRRLRIMT